MPPSETEGKADQQTAALWRIVAAALGVIWIASLIAMAIWSSNPVTLNRRQIHRALNEGVIVRARVVDVQSGQCETIEFWPAGEFDDTFRVVNLQQTGATSGTTYLLPLRRDDGGLAVVPSLPDEELPLIYPDTAEAIAQLQSLLAE